MIRATRTPPGLRNWITGRIILVSEINDTSTTIIQILKPGGVLIALIKPQFEVGKGEVGKGGIVRDESKHKEVANKITQLIAELNLDVRGVIPSPITGAQGNKEFLVSAVKTVE